MNVAQILKANHEMDLIDGELLLAHTLGKSRTWLVTHYDYELSTAEEKTFNDFSDRRIKGEPAAYIIGEKEFYGRMFHVTPATLIPRPSTELLVEQALKILRNESIEVIQDIDTDIVAQTLLWKDASNVRRVVDVGTGSGCIAVTLACEISDLHIIATDISGDALRVARRNAQRHAVSDRIEFRQGGGMDPVMDIDEPFLIVSNPPYIPAGMPLQKDVHDFEPHAALFAGERGLDVIDPLIEAARNHPQCVGMILEMRRDQAIYII